MKQSRRRQEAIERKRQAAARRRREAFALEEALQEWADSARDVLVDLAGMDQETAARLGRELVVRFAEDHTGEQLYFAKGQSYSLDVRDQEIYAEFNGRNHHQLARKYGVAPRHIYRLVRRARAVDTNQRIDDMFPDRELPDRR